MLRVVHVPGINDPKPLPMPIEIAPQLSAVSNEDPSFYTSENLDSAIEIQPDETSPVAIPSFIFKTGPKTIRIPLAKLSDFHGIFPVDRCGNAVSIHAVELTNDVCARGFLKGVWEKDNQTFYGAYKSLNGRITGYLKGVYGKGTFHGKYIEENGRFKGFLKGIYRDLPNLPGGIFNGKWVDASLRRLHGYLGGHYAAFPPHTYTNDNRPSGFFHGRWVRMCK
jgi:hypothetical protein